MEAMKYLRNETASGVKYLTAILVITYPRDHRVMVIAA